MPCAAIWQRVYYCAELAMLWYVHMMIYVLLYVLSCMADIVLSSICAAIQIKPLLLFHLCHMSVFHSPRAVKKIQRNKYFSCRNIYFSIVELTTVSLVNFV